MEQKHRVGIRAPPEPVVRGQLPVEDTLGMRERGSRTGLPGGGHCKRMGLEAVTRQRFGWKGKKMDVRAVRRGQC